MTAIVDDKASDSSKSVPQDKERQLGDDAQGKVFIEEDGAWEEEQIAERKLSWKAAAALLLTEYVVLAILAFPYSYAILGMAGGVLTTLLVGLMTLFTSHVLWRYCMQHRQVRDICDVAFQLTGGRRWAWYVAFVGLALNNWAIMGLHCNAAAVAVQTIRQGTESSLLWATVMTIIMLLGSLLRDFRHMSLIGLLASSTMFACTIVVLAGHITQANPNGYTEALGVAKITVWAPEGTTFVQGMNALLNIVYTWSGQILLPSFIGDMEKPEDFPKALYVSMTAEVILFTVTGVVVYYYTGTQYTTAPAYGSLLSKFGKIAAGLTLPTILIVGLLYSLVTSRAIFFQFFNENSKHRRRHTVKGWGVWTAIVVAGWIISFVLGQAVPFFNDLLSLIASVFSSWFGFIFWSAAWYEIYKGQRLKGVFRIGENLVAALVLVTGIFLFGAGTYSSVQSILNSYAVGAIGSPFPTANTGFTFTG